MKVAIIGGGNMGSTYAKAFVRNNMVKEQDLIIVEKHPEKRKELTLEVKARLLEEINAEISGVDIIILAVKPQDFKIVAAELATHLRSPQLILSIMAGITISTIKNLLKQENVLRAMPNTPAQLGFGITAFTANKDIPFESISIVDTLLETTGKSIFMKDEAMLDAVTALSGSGPAYFYYFVKSMIQAGVEMGIDEPVSSLLVKQTMLGSFQIMNNSKLTLDEMIQMVASKGGTTEAALTKLDDAEVGGNIIKALKAAEQRAKELAAANK